MILCFFPLLQYLGYGLTVREAVFCVWGGLKGACVIILALVFCNTSLDGLLVIDPNEGEKVFFIIGGVSALTLLINGTLCSFVLRALDLDNHNSDQSEIIQHYARRRLQKNVKEKIDNLNASLRGFQSNVIDRVADIAVVETVTKHAPSTPRLIQQARKNARQKKFYNRQQRSSSRSLFAEPESPRGRRLSAAEFTGMSYAISSFETSRRLSIQFIEVVKSI